ncbi:MAG: M48 family metalloprotease [Shimia sp.]
MFRPFFLIAALGLVAGCVAPMPGTMMPPSDTSAAVPVPNDNADPARTFRAVVQRMEPVAERECRERSSTLNCDFAIVVDDRRRQPPNAFQTLGQGGRPILGFTISLIEDVRNGDEMAFIFGHEAAHHIAGHLARQEQNATLGAAVFGTLAARGGAGTQAVQSALELGAAVGARSYSKQFELEADSLGAVIALRGGFDPVRGSAYFERVPDPGDQFLGTHPANAERVAVVRRAAAQELAR